MFGPVVVFVSITVLLLALLALVMLGMYVVRTYPDSKDPGRNRFNGSAVSMLLLAALSLVGIFVGLIFTMVRI